MMGLVGCGEQGFGVRSPSESVIALSCTGWISDSEPAAAQFRANLFEGGQINAMPASLNLSYSGTLPAYVANGLQYPTTSLYSRLSVGSEMNLSFKLNSVTATSPSFASFVAIQNETTGIRWSFSDDGGGNYLMTRTTWDKNGTYLESTSPAVWGMTVKAYREESGRLVWEYYDDIGDQTGGGYYDGISGEINIGLGLQNISPDGSGASGQITSSFSEFEIQTTRKACNAIGFL